MSDKIIFVSGLIIPAEFKYFARGEHSSTSTEVGVFFRERPETTHNRDGDKTWVASTDGVELHAEVVFGPNMYRNVLPPLQTYVELDLWHVASNIEDKTTTFTQVYDDKNLISTCDLHDKLGEPFFLRFRYINSTTPDRVLGCVRSGSGQILLYNPWTPATSLAAFPYSEYRPGMVVYKHLEFGQPAVTSYVPVGPYWREVPLEEETT